MDGERGRDGGRKEDGRRRGGGEEQEEEDQQGQEGLDYDKEQEELQLEEA